MKKWAAISTENLNTRPAYIHVYTQEHIKLLYPKVEFLCFSTYRQLRSMVDKSSSSLHSPLGQPKIGCKASFHYIQDYTLLKAICFIACIRI